MPAPHYQHDCPRCTFLGTATVNESPPVDFYSCPSGSLVWRYSSEPSDYGSAQYDCITALSTHGMIAFGLYLQHLKIDGANNAWLRGKYFSNGKLTLSIPLSTL